MLCLLTEGYDDALEVEAALAGAARGFQNGVRPQGPTMKRLFVVLQDELHEASQRNIHLVLDSDITIETRLAFGEVHTCPVFDDAPQ